MTDKKKAILEFVGRLGNQMYTYCTALRLKQSGYSVKFDMEYFDWWPKKRKHRWSNELYKFNVKLPRAKKSEIAKFLFRTNNRYVNALLKKKKYFTKKVIWIKERKDFENFPNKIYLLGFEANMPFIEKNIQKIRLAFSLKKKYVKNIKNIILEVRNCNSVCLNVRRGDLLNYKDANVLPIEYYKKAVKIMDKRVSNPTYYITSDEIEWCKSNFDWLKNKRFLDHDGYENLEIGKNCKHNILANSTFSWWAGMLNSNPHKIVICPKKFYIRAMDKNDIQTPFPIGWVSID